MSNQNAHKVSRRHRFYSIVRATVHVEAMRSTRPRVGKRKIEKELAVCVPTQLVWETTGVLCGIVAGGWTSLNQSGQRRIVFLSPSHLLPCTEYVRECPGQYWKVNEVDLGSFPSLEGCTECHRGEREVSR